MLKKLTIPAKVLQPLTMVGNFNLWMASNLLHNGLTHTLFSWIKMVLPMYCNSVLNNWHFFGDIFRPYLSHAFSKSSSFVMWDCFEGVNNSRSSLITSQYFLLSWQSRIACICSISKLVIFIIVSWCYAIMHVLHIYAIWMCMWWWSHHMTSLAKHYKKGIPISCLP